MTDAAISCTKYPFILPTQSLDVKMSLDKSISPTLLVILDGFGDSQKNHENAITQANMPTLTQLKNQYSWTLLQASGEHVGLPSGYIGNSEVGHLTIGAGRIIESDLKRIHESIDNGSFFTNKTLLNRLNQLKDSRKTLHLIGLLSDAGVHSHEKHLHSLLTLSAQIGLNQVVIHAFIDGRDVPPQSATTYLQRLDDLCQKLGIGTIGSLHGRFYAMDRDNNLDRTQVSFDVLTQRNHIASVSWQEALKQSYANNLTDEFFYPQIIESRGHTAARGEKPIRASRTIAINHTTIQPEDGVIFFNFRPDRARQLTAQFLGNPKLPLAFFITMTRYQKKFTTDVLFEKEIIKHTLLDEIVAQKPQAKLYVIAETEKYAHVTYFFRGMREKKFPNETQMLIPSLKVKDYTERPEMSAQAITDAVINSITHDPAYFYLINYANADMVGHSGNLEATVKACEILDEQLEQLYRKVVLEFGGTIFITADHGNAEEKLDSKGNPLTAHTTNPVIFLMIRKDFKQKKILAKTGLAVIAPTILYYLGLRIPREMDEPITFLD